MMKTVWTTLQDKLSAGFSSQMYSKQSKQQMILFLQYLQWHQVEPGNSNIQMMILKGIYFICDRFALARIQIGPPFKVHSGIKILA